MFDGNSHKTPSHPLKLFALIDEYFIHIPWRIIPTLFNFCFPGHPEAKFLFSGEHIILNCSFFSWFGKSSGLHTFHSIPFHLFYQELSRIIIPLHII